MLTDLFDRIYEINLIIDLINQKTTIILVVLVCFFVISLLFFSNIRDHLKDIKDHFNIKRRDPFSHFDKAKKIDKMKEK